MFKFELEKISFKDIKKIKKLLVDKIIFLPSDKICHQRDNNQSSWKMNIYLLYIK